MFKLTINLGLENNPRANDRDATFQMVDFLRWCLDRNKLMTQNGYANFHIDATRKDGTYNGNHEDTLILTVRGPQSGRDRIQNIVIETVDKMLHVYEQECIAWQLDVTPWVSYWKDVQTVQSLQYSDEYNGERFMFDINYFLTS